MARKPNYNFERMERERLKANKAAAKATAKREARERGQEPGAEPQDKVGADDAD